MNEFFYSRSKDIMINRKIIIELRSESFIECNDLSTVAIRPKVMTHNTVPSIPVAYEISVVSSTMQSG